MKYLKCSVFVFSCFLLLACRSQQQTHEVISQQVTACEWHHGESQALWLDSLSKQLSAEFDSLEFWIEPVPVVEERAPSQSRVKPALRIRGKAKSASLKSESSNVKAVAESSSAVDSTSHQKETEEVTSEQKDAVSVFEPPDVYWPYLAIIVFVCFIVYKGMR